MIFLNISIKLKLSNGFSNAFNFKIYRNALVFKDACLGVFLHDYYVFFWNEATTFYAILSKAAVMISLLSTAVQLIQTEQLIQPKLHFFH